MWSHVSRVLVFKKILTAFSLISSPDSRENATEIFLNTKTRLTCSHY
jgi:hypothetical protein